MLSVTESSRVRAQMATCTSKLFGSRKRLAQLEREKHHLELSRSFDRDRSSNAVKLANLNKFVSMYLKATLNIIHSIPTVESSSIGDSATTNELRKRRNDLKIIRRVYKRSKDLKRSLVQRTGRKNNSRNWNARKIFLQTDPAYNISSCHI